MLQAALSSRAAATTPHVESGDSPEVLATRRHGRGSSTARRRSPASAHAASCSRSTCRASSPAEAPLLLKPKLRRKAKSKTRGVGPQQNANLTPLLQNSRWLQGVEITPSPPLTSVPKITSDELERQTNDCRSQGQRVESNVFHLPSSQIPFHILCPRMQHIFDRNKLLLTWYLHS